MNQTELLGPYVLTVDSIDQHLDGIISPGVVVFGEYDLTGQWMVRKVDRSDSHVRARLWANSADFSHFCFQLCASAIEAYRLHCELYHKYKPPIGQHPGQPENSELQCHVCAKQKGCTHTEALPSSGAAS